MNKNALLFLLHIPVWIAVFFFGLVIVYNSIELADTPSLIITSLVFSFWLLASFYWFYYRLVPVYLEKRKYKKFAIYAILTVFVIVPFDQLWNWLAFYYTGGIGYPAIGKANFSSPDFNDINLVYIYAGSVLGTLFCGGLGTFYRFGIDWFKNLEQKKDLETKNLLSELKTLKSKLNPHVLFNTLNNIDALIQTNPQQASAALSKLSDILRYVVYDTEHDNISITKEIEILEKYIMLEKMRIVHPESIEFNSKVLEHTTVPPMLFFPFVENGFKHSNLNNPKHKLKISIIEDNNKISFSCTNTINKHKQRDVYSGMGLELAKKRLNLLFPWTHNLTIEEGDKEFQVDLEIQK